MKTSISKEASEDKGKGGPPSSIDFYSRQNQFIWEKGANKRRKWLASKLQKNLVTLLLNESVCRGCKIKLYSFCHFLTGAQSDLW